MKNITDNSFRYARSLFAAIELSELDAVLSSADKFLSLYMNQLLQATLHSPRFTVNEKINIIHDLAKQYSLNSRFVNMLKLLMLNKKIQQVVAIIEAFKMIAYEAKGELLVKVYSAADLTVEQKTTLKQSLAKKFNKTILLQEHIDSTLLSGFVVQVNSLRIDNSITNKLHHLSTAMKGINI